MCVLQAAFVDGSIVECFIIHRGRRNNTCPFFQGNFDDTFTGNLAIYVLFITPPPALPPKNCFIDFRVETGRSLLTLSVRYCQHLMYHSITTSLINYIYGKKTYVVSCFSARHFVCSLNQRNSVH